MVAPNWRPQLRDIVRTLRDAHPEDLRLTALASGLLHMGTGRVDGLGVLFSDGGHSALVDAAARIGRRPQVFRLWWNTGDEIAAFISGGAGAGEVHICFFEDQRPAPEAIPMGTAVVVVPYAFTPPVRTPMRPTKATIGYAAEVDTSDACFANVVPEGEVATVSARSWELARAVVEGTLTLVAADAALRLDLDGSGWPAAHCTTLWAVRNRVRFLLVQGLLAAFPGRLELRGSDWAALGFQALPTRFRRRRRLTPFGEHRVAIDLGSKSTHSWLYPRTADILAAGGGLLQFESGAHGPELVPGLERRRARSLPDLVSAAERLLSLPAGELAAENDALYRSYGELRLRVGAQLAREIGEHRR
jgi:hypothetical protein